MLLLRNITINQQIHQWEYMLLHERDILAQIQALHIINKFPIHQTYTTLVETVKNERLFYK